MSAKLGTVRTPTPIRVRLFDEHLRRPSESSRLDQVATADSVAMASGRIIYAVRRRGKIVSHFAG
jgi:hypothetical protein